MPIDESAALRQPACGYKPPFTCVFGRTFRCGLCPRNRPTDCQRIFEHYLEEVHKLGAELSVSNLLAGSSDALKALADASRDQSPHRTDEPYRRALIGIYTRLAASARVRLGEGVVAVRSAGPGAPQIRAKPYADAAEFSRAPPRCSTSFSRASTCGGGFNRSMQ
ncbi:phosphoenolpyruvate carboxylase [Caballeronia pedi]|uniref:Phosphoenolpyruvate carboxylase n=1 Tax=Caballeronia pedi TaxID=1777141 RepID=A0A158DEE9_9BURK|nr:phosphoenolpyruvate carboxylase [Caballeronia pedi]